MLLVHREKLEGHTIKCVFLLLFASFPKALLRSMAEVCIKLSEAAISNPTEQSFQSKKNVNDVLPPKRVMKRKHLNM